MTVKQLIKELEDMLNNYEIFKDDKLYITDESGDKHEITQLSNFSSFTEFPDGTRSETISGLEMKYDI